MSFSFLEDYKITSEQIETQGVKSIGRSRHQFFSVPEFQIEQALAEFDPFPEELKTFYYEIGFGFMHRRKFGKFSILLDPVSLIYTNKQVNYFATPEVARELKYCDTANQLLFFKTASNQYLAIDRTTVRDKNTVYYRGTVIGESLYDFLKQYDFNRYALAQQTDEADTEEKIPSATPDIAPPETSAAVPPSKERNNANWSALIDDDDTVI